MVPLMFSIEGALSILLAFPAFPLIVIILVAGREILGLPLISKRMEGFYLLTFYLNL